MEKKDEGLRSGTQCSTILDRWDARVLLRAGTALAEQQQSLNKGTRDGGKGDYKILFLKDGAQWLLSL